LLLNPIEEHFMFDDQTKSNIAVFSTKLAVPTAALLAVAEVESAIGRID